MKVLRRSDALSCSYCRGPIAGSRTSDCGEPSCTALYHGECWVECSTHFGGCAIPGCGRRPRAAAGSPATRVVSVAASESVTAFACLAAFVVGVLVFMAIVAASLAYLPRGLTIFLPGVFYVAASVALSAARTTCELCGAEFPWRY